MRSSNFARGEADAVDLPNDSVSAAEIQDGAVDRLEIDTDAVGVPEIATDAVGGAEIAPNAVGGAEIASNVVGSSELGSIHEHRAGEFLEDDVAHDGLYALGSRIVMCEPDEDLLSASIDWGDGGADVGHAEKMLANVVIDRAGTDSATVQGAFDGGGGPDELASYDAVATCIGP